MSRPENPLQRTWNFFTERPKADPVSTHPLVMPTEEPKTFFRRSRLLAIPRAFVRASTEGLYNVDQIFLTPIRTLMFILGGLAVTAGTATVISLGVLTAIPGIMFIAIVPAAIFLVGSLFRGIFAKTKDPLFLLKQSFDEAKIPLTQITIDDGEELDVKFFTHLVRKENIKEDGAWKEKYFLTAYYEIKDESYLSNLDLGKEEYNAYLKLNDQKQTVEIKKRLTTAIAKIFREKKLKERPEDSVETTEKPNFLQRRWEAFKSLCHKHYSTMSPFEIIRESLWVPFKFFFGGAMVYWAIWLIAALSGIGIIGLGLASEALIPFGSVWLAFAIPLGAAVLLGLFRGIAAYQERNTPKNSADTKSLIEMLFQTTAAKKAAEKLLAKAGQPASNETLEERITRLAPAAATTAAAAATPIAPVNRWNTFWYAIATLFVTDYSIRNMLNSSMTAAIVRITTHTVTRFATGFILAFISLWPLCDFGILSLGAPGVILVTAQFAIAIFAGLCFAGYNLVKQIPEEKDRLEAFAKISSSKEEGILLKLEDNLILKRANLAKLEKDVTDLTRGKAKDRVKTLSEEQQKYLKEEGRNIIAHDNWDFTGKYNLKEKSLAIKFWTFLKKGFDRVNEFLAAGGSGGLMIRLAVGASGLGLGLFGGAIGFGTPVIIALAVFGFAWACIRLLKLLDSKNVRAAKQFLTRGTQAAKETMVAELEILQARTAMLNSIKTALSGTATTDVPDDAPPPHPQHAALDAVEGHYAPPGTAPSRQSSTASPESQAVGAPVDRTPFVHGLAARAGNNEVSPTRTHPSVAANLHECGLFAEAAPAAVDNNSSDITAYPAFTS